MVYALYKHFIYAITGEEEVGNKVQKGSIPLTLDTKLEINMILFFSEHL